MDQFLSDLSLFWDGALDATATLWVPLAEIYATMPSWAIASVAAGIFALFGILVFGGRRLGGDRIDRHASANRPAPNADHKSPPQDTPSESLPIAPAMPDAPEIRGLSEILDAQGLDTAKKDGRLRTFAGELEDLRSRLDHVGATTSATARLFHDAKEAMASGDLGRGTDLLIRAADEEGTSADNLTQSASNHGRAAALARLIAADLMVARGDTEEAETLYLLAADATPVSMPELRIECLGRLGSLAHNRGNFEQARDCFASALTTIETSGLEAHPDLGGILNNLGLATDLVGDHDTAELHYQRALQADEVTYGDNHPNVAAILNNLALLYRRQNKTHAAEPLFRRAVTIKEATLLPGDPGLALSQVNYAATLRDLGREDDARALERRAGLPHPEPEPGDQENEDETSSDEISGIAQPSDSEPASIR